MTKQRPSPAIVKAKLAEVKRRYRRRRRTPAQLASLRLRDLSRVYRARYGETLPDDDAGREDAQIALDHLASLAAARGRMTAWITLWAPWLSTGEAKIMIDASLTGQRYWKADRLAWRLRLTAADRSTLGITTIGAIDLPKTAREEARKRKARERAKAWRQRKRTTPYAP